ncbi:DUF3618 domain-containing protein [uncultured Sphingomonas sp.]|uniref:DUF3618 domain-containing protein n=1 Tax=Sphingomonas sp. TaxID=28214 RepID=UPI00262B1703|nr:DUF3618 domain-containing protein [uncultured Sphingomonas sp.]
MSDEPVRHLADAEAQAAAARERLSHTVGQLQARLDPKLLAREAREAGLQAARSGVDNARRNPGVVAGATGLLGLFLVRKPLCRLLRRRPKNTDIPAKHPALREKPAAEKE